VFDLSNNKLQDLPAEMGYLARLRSFSVNENSNLKTLFPLEQLNQLQYMGLRNTLLDELPEDLCTLPSIVELDLRNNLQIGRIPPEIGRLTTLRRSIPLSRRRTFALARTDIDAPHTHATRTGLICSATS
jgi:Leucine-rich repeat (LRR) protein